MEYVYFFKATVEFLNSRLAGLASVHVVVEFVVHSLVLSTLFEMKDLPGDSKREF